ncbi:hypothetical protein BGY98DRAFT_691546 [Russula aff. rugulosa BPL654]|nr:hypothetical protein BGY98DRAFT_691546 [Russula aff. rugulosa BPL654]
MSIESVVGDLSDIPRSALVRFVASTTSLPRQIVSIYLLTPLVASGNGPLLCLALKSECTKLRRRMVRVFIVARPRSGPSSPAHKRFCTTRRPCIIIFVVKTFISRQARQPLAPHFQRTSHRGRYLWQNPCQSQGRSKRPFQGPRALLRFVSVVQTRKLFHASVRTYVADKSPGRCHP